MADKPIIFSGPMIRALLDGRKTQTRRVLKPQPYESVHEWHKVFAAPPYFEALDRDGKPLSCAVPKGKYLCEPFPPIKIGIGDLLWVRETFTLKQYGKAVYRADARDETGQSWTSISSGDPEGEVKWTSPIFMPRIKSRLTLTVTDVRVQRLQDISEADAVAEGIEQISQREGVQIWRNYANAQSLLREGGLLMPTASFHSLWNSIHGPEAWDANPWVAAYTFDVKLQNIDEVKA